MSTALAAARAKTRGKRMLRDALEGYGKDEFTLSEWNAKKKAAAEQGTWMWKQSVVDSNQAIKARIEKHGDVLESMKDRFVDISAAMQQEINQARLGPSGSASQLHGVSAPDCCEWSERVGRKRYRCTNAPVAVKGSKPSPNGDYIADKEQGEPAVSTSGERLAAVKRLCLWHVRECQYKHHPMEHSRAIEVANDQGMCLRCYEATAATERKTLQRSPPRVIITKTPGVCLSDEKSAVMREMLYKTPKASGSGVDAPGPRLTAASTCCWQKEHFERAYVWRCTNRVLMHPTLRGSFLPFCGFHAARCIRDYGLKRTGNSTTNANCPAIERRNQFGMCRNHLEAQLSELTFEARGGVVLADSEFDVPGIKECKKEAAAVPIRRHPLAPAYPPPNTVASVRSNDDTLSVPVLSKPDPNTTIAGIAAASIAKFVSLVLQALALLLSQTLHVLLNHSNPVSAFVKEAIWRLQFIRRASVVAIRIQRIFRGNRARRRARMIRYEAAALRRIAGCRAIQRIVRGFLDRRRFMKEAERVDAAVPHMQRLFRGGLARLHCRRLRAAIRLQRNYRWYRQRLLAWNFREEVAYLRSLQREADDNLRTLERQLAAFRRIRARRVMSRHIERWRHRKETKQREVARRIQTLLGTIKIQRQWRRHHRSMEIQRRYDGAQQIQRCVRGWLTRHMWSKDPGILVIVGFVSSRTAFEYGRTIVLPLLQGSQTIGSYAYPTRCIRMGCGAVAIQRVFRGHLGRLRANAMWAAMLKRWEWIGMSSDSTNSSSSDSMTLGRERYGFVLPSHSYHWDSRQHMRPVVRDAMPDRGHAYKYQFILDLIKDRDGRRAWSMERERKWLRDHGAQMSPKVLSQSPDKVGASSKRFRRPAAEAARGIPLAKAVYPIGSLVDVVQIGYRAAAKRTDNSRGPVTRRGRVVAVNSPIAVDDEPTFDIAYSQKERIERRVATARVSHAEFGVDKPLPRPKKPAGAIIQAAIDKLTQELEGKERRIQCATLQLATENDDEPLPTIEAIAERLEDNSSGRDLLADQRDFVKFVFRNSALLELKWLDVVDLVRRSRRAEKEAMLRQGLLPQHHSPPNESVKWRTHPTLAMLSQEFGFQTPGPSLNNHSVLKTATAAELADEIERRMTKLGFHRSSNPCAPSFTEFQSPDNVNQLPQRPVTGSTPTSGVDRGRLYRETIDDLRTVTGSPGQSPQDIHRFIYELKTLPRLRHREKIIQVTSRNARSFICGHPACGRCFSSQEAARMHQKATHEGQERLASAAPLTDQYQHSYWPPQTPWTDRDATNAVMVGYFACSQPDCRSQFRSRRDLSRHLSDAHGIEASSNPGTSQSVSTPQRSERNLHPTDSAIMWLGPFTLCRNLGAKLAVPWNRFEPCGIHRARMLDDCAACRVLEQLPMMPARCYVSVALSTPFAGRGTSTGEEKRVNDDVGSMFAILSTEDPRGAVAVDAMRVLIIRSRDGVAVKGHCTEEKRNGSPRQSRLRSQMIKKPPRLVEQPKIMFVQVTVLCRDARNEAWAIGHPFVSTECVDAATGGIPLPTAATMLDKSDSADRYIVRLDHSQIAVVRLRAAIGVAVVLDTLAASRVVPTSSRKSSEGCDVRADLTSPAADIPDCSRKRDGTGVGTSIWRTFKLLCSESHA